MTQSQEDYLETIYLITVNNSVARVKEISEKLNVKKPSVITAVKELSKREFITQEKYGYITLTEKGKEEAKKIFGKHTLIKNFLMSVLLISETNAEKDACLMEHYLSEETITKIDNFLKKSN